MLAEMKEESADFNEIRKEQLVRSRQYMELDQWLASPDSIPLDSAGEILDLVFSRAEPAVPLVETVYSATTDNTISGN